GILVRATRQLEQRFEASRRQHGRLVRVEHGVEEAVQDRDLPSVLLLERSEERLVLLPLVPFQELGTFPPEFALGGTPHEVMALSDEVELQGIELLGLDQHLLSHADLAEIVE